MILLKHPGPAVRKVSVKFRFSKILQLFLVKLLQLLLLRLIRKIRFVYKALKK